MVATALETVRPHAHARGLETGFIVERYHRAFDDEASQLRNWLRHAALDTDGVLPAIEVLAHQLRRHTSFQEHHVFPQFEAGLPCGPRLFDAWSVDALRLFGCIAGVRSSLRPLDGPAPLLARARHFIDEVQDHLVAEAQVLSTWKGFGA